MVTYTTCPRYVAGKHQVQMAALKDVNAKKTSHCLEHDVLECVTDSVTSLKISHLLGTKVDM